MKKNKDEEKTEFRMLREASGLRMAEAARKTGTAYKTWENWEMGRSRVPGLAIAWLELHTQLKKII